MQQTIDVQINPSEETIRLGPLAVRFLITRENSGGSIAVFELTVPSQVRRRSHSTFRLRASLNSGEQNMVRGAAFRVKSEVLAYSVPSTATGSTAIALACRQPAGGERHGGHNADRFGVGQGIRRTDAVEDLS